MFGPNDIYLDGLWIGMNEASNFCPYPCNDPAAYAEAYDYPPDTPAMRTNPRPLLDSSGIPLISPLFFQYPTDPTTFPIDLQLLFGLSLLVSPVTDEQSTSVAIHLPPDLYYDYYTHLPIHSTGSYTTSQTLTTPQSLSTS
ncbi:putative alpha-glucosidase [Phaeomoniella chlamydospora]|uniref:Putative alpha-glucosidase n=1 Tax=Phaeomoniella chlamydospora TaxID=158046 RepID=A0A0G2ER74_PHACM|nr:putative alpha-glucosidase [Phaeomoniella chlamydospora]